MANQRQGDVVTETRAVARSLDEALTDLEALIARYGVLNLETPNFAAGYFATAQEITANDLLGVYNSRNALVAAATPQWDALRAALRKART
jgi:hypothetical protein